MALSPACPRTPSLPATSLAVLCLLLGAPAAGAAESGPDEQPVPSELLVSDLKVGPFYLKPGLALERLGTDSNVFLTATDKQRDLTATLVPSLRVALPFGDNVFSVAQRFEYLWYRKFDTERGLNSDTAIGLDLAIGDLRLDLEESFRSTRQRFETEILSRPRRIESHFTATLSTPRDAGLYFEGRGSHELIRFRSQEEFEGRLLSEALDRTEVRGGLEAFLDFSGASRLILGGELGANRFRHGGEDKDGSAWFAFGGLRFEPEHLVTGDLRVGFARLAVRREDHPDFSGLAFRGALAFELAEDSYFRLEGSRSPEFSAFAGNVWFEQTRLAASLKVPVADRLQLEFGPAWLRASYPVPAATPEGASVDRRDTVVSIHGDATIALTENLGVRLGVTGRRLRSNFPGFGYSNFGFTTGLRYGS